MKRRYLDFYINASKCVSFRHSAVDSTPHVQTLSLQTLPQALYGIHTGFVKSLASTGPYVARRPFKQASGGDGSHPINSSINEQGRSHKGPSIKGVCTKYLLY